MEYGIETIRNNRKRAVTTHRLCDEYTDINDMFHVDQDIYMGKIEQISNIEELIKLTSMQIRLHGKNLPEKKQHLRYRKFQNTLI